MRSFIRLVMFRRYNNNNNNNGSPYSKKVPSLNNTNNSDNSNGNGTSSMSLLSLLAIETINNHNVRIIHNNGSGYRMNGSISLNEWYHMSSNGTLGPSTVTFMRMSWKGERTLSRSRLEVCPAIASFIMSGMLLLTFPLQRTSPSPSSSSSNW
jgi:hypothetical protein